MIDTQFSIPLPNNGEKYMLSEDELKALCRDAFNSGFNTAKILYDTVAYTNIVKSCPKCGYPMFKYPSLVYTSNPPKYDYVCQQCGHTIIDF